MAKIGIYYFINKSFCDFVGKIIKTTLWGGVFENVTPAPTLRRGRGKIYNTGNGKCYEIPRLLPDGKSKVAL